MARILAKLCFMDPVLVSLDAGVLKLTLNRPDRLNAFNADLHAGLAEALSRAEREPAVRCVLVTGAGRGFCAGADLTGRDLKADKDVDLGETLERSYNPLVRR